MIQANTKTFVINVKDLSFKSERLVADLMRYLTEQLPQIGILQKNVELEVTMPTKLSKRLLRHRIRKFLYKKRLSEDFRPISYKDSEKEGYAIKEKKLIEMSYY